MDDPTIPEERTDGTALHKQRFLPADAECDACTLFSGAMRGMGALMDGYNSKSCSTLEKSYYKPIEAALLWCVLKRNMERSHFQKGRLAILKRAK